MKERTYFIILSDNDSNVCDTEEIKTQNIDDVLHRASVLMEETDYRINIWEKEDYEEYKRREKQYA